MPPDHWDLPLLPYELTATLDDPCSTDIDYVFWKLAGTDTTNYLKSL